MRFEFDNLADIIRRRRSCKNFMGTPVARDVIQNLLELAIWAPNHRLTEPWRFRILTSSTIERWQSTVKDKLTEDEFAPFKAGFERMLLAGHVIYVTCIKNADPQVYHEDLMAVAAAVQNILLGATAKGLESFWSTNRLMTHPVSLEFLKISIQQESFVGALFIGHGEVPASVRRSPVSEKTQWIP